MPKYSNKVAKCSRLHSSPLNSLHCVFDIEIPEILTQTRDVVVVEINQ